MIGDDIAYWNSEAAGFDEAADHGLSDPSIRQAWRELLVSVLPPQPVRVADLGCGTGTLSLLLADMGYEVDGLDFSAAMLDRARAKAEGRTRVAFHLGDAADPGLPLGSYEVVLSRHVLWALRDPAESLRRWARLLSPTGRLVLIEGYWHTGAGMTAAETVDLLTSIGRQATLTELRDPALWGRDIDDERYLVLSR